MSDSTDDLAVYRQEWQDVISRMIAQAWLDAEFRQSLLDDPTPHLHAAGLHFPDRYVVEFYEDPSAQPGDWHSVGRGQRAVHRFPIPPAPDALATRVEHFPLVDASALACCCPCASCTGAASPDSWV